MDKTHYFILRKILLLSIDYRESKIVISKSSLGGGGLAILTATYSCMIQ